MGSIGTPVTQVIPALATAGPTYAQNINDFLTEVKTRLEAKVPFSSILGSGGSLDANNNGIINAHHVALYALTSAPTAVSTANLSLSTYNGDLYWVTSSGTLQITSGTALNASGIGGIGGDYGGANPAKENFVDATSTYEFYDDFGGLIWGYTKSKGHYFVSTADNSKYAFVQYGGSGTPTYKLPTAPPGANNSAVSLDSTGQFSTGTITNDIVLSGTTKVQHGNRSIVLNLSEAVTTGGSLGVAYGGAANRSGYVTIGAAFPLSVQVAISGVLVGQRLQSVAIRHNKTTAGNTTFRVFKAVDGSNTALSALSTDNTATTHTTTVSLTSPYSVAAAEAYYIDISHPVAGDTVYGIQVTYDQN